MVLVAAVVVFVLIMAMWWLDMTVMMIALQILTMMVMKMVSWAIDFIVALCFKILQGSVLKTYNSGAGPTNPQSPAAIETLKAPQSEACGQAEGL